MVRSVSNHRYWMDTFANEIANKHQKRINHDLLEFINKIKTSKHFPKAPEAMQQVLSSMVNAQVDMSEYFNDIWH